MYSVIWTGRALNELALLWMNADSRMREAIVVAADRLDRLLRSDPYGDSESRLNGKRIQFLDPLGVLFSVIDDRTVKVGHVWSINRWRQR